jgi:Mevalonate kinase
MAQNWYSNGKLMITGEYFVLFGAKALAMPVKYGQSLEIEEIDDEPGLMFVTHLCGKPWFGANFDSRTLEILNTDDCTKACYLQELLLASRVLNPKFLRKSKKLLVVSNINFDIKWGLGSSSSLISNIAWWAKIDPYELNRMISQGSGYDIACARSRRALLYSLTSHVPTVEHVTFNPACASQIWFVYLEKKEATEANLLVSKDKLSPTRSQLKEISDISVDFTNATNVSEIEALMRRHEEIIAGALQKEPVQTLMFPDFKGTIKSLGAWGGDFCMVVSVENEVYIRQYFEQKGFKTVLSFKDVIIR